MASAYISYISGLWYYDVDCDVDMVPIYVFYKAILELIRVSECSRNFIINLVTYVT